MPLMQSIILASRSPWRKRLLRKHGIACKILVTDFKELKRHKDPRKLVIHNACGKAKGAAAHIKNHSHVYSEYKTVVGIDTVGVLGKRILGKPKSLTHAARMIRILAGTTHTVISGLCVMDIKTGAHKTATETTRITFRKISAAELKQYLDSNHWKGKAGAYAIQGRAKGFVARIDGEIENVIGVPLRKLKKLL